VRLKSLAITLLLASACDTGEPPVADDAPVEAKEDDTRFTLDGARSWYLAGNALTPGNDTLAFTVAGPASVVDVWIDGRYAKRATKTGGKFTFSIDIKALPVGAHRALLAADGAHIAFRAVSFQKSHPLYVVVSNDWDDPDHGDDKLERQERLHARHPKLVITHFVGPYTFTDASVTPARRKVLVDWVKRYAASSGDEIGLHIHPWCNFVTTAGVTCRTAPSFAYANGDTTGYTVILASYTRAELDKLFRRATELFVQNGLPRPTSFRAGGWTANEDVLASVAGAGHVADSSGCNWVRLESWRNHPGASLYAWNQEHWSSIDDTSQPYYPSASDMQADAAPHLPLLEIPDNGILVDYITGSEMIDVLNKNWPSHTALREPVTYSIGYHPVSFSETYFQRLDQALTEVDKYLAADGKGPIVYARMSELTKVYPR
jgi:hypothetical protein